ncbi:MAG: ArnT family glycosyltransferase [Parachlamydiaceae bacterium]
MAIFKNKLFLLVVLLLLKAIIVGGFILYSGIELGPDEAQYWTWSQQLDWGYYSKPPGIAWQIRSGTFLFGNTVFGVRFGSLILGSLLPLAVFFLARSSHLREDEAFLAGVIMAFSPLGFLATFFAITDVGVVLFWTLGLIPLMLGMSKQQAPNYNHLGLIIACGALFKWQIFWLWLLILLLIVFYPEFRSFKIFSGLFISLLGLAPSLYWNLTHEWATFRHVGATIAGSSAPSRANPLDFLLAQAALVSPILFILLVGALFASLKSTKILRVLGGSSLAIISIHLFLACFKKMQGNWCDYTYPAGFIVLAWFCREGSKLAWLKIGIILSLILSLLALALPTLMAVLPSSMQQITFRHNIGWEKIGPILRQVGYQDHQDFLFASSYQTTSIASFYNSSQKRAYFFNLNGVRKNQFSFWPQMGQKERGKNGYFLVIESGKDAARGLKCEVEHYQAKMQPYFERIDDLGVFPLISQENKIVKALLILKCENYNGKYPKVEIVNY